MEQIVPLSAMTQILSSSCPPDPLSLISTPRNTPIVPGAGIAHISADRLSVPHCDVRLSKGTVFVGHHEPCVNWIVGAFRLKTTKCYFMILTMPGTSISTANTYELVVLIETSDTKVV